MLYPSQWGRICATGHGVNSLKGQKDKILLVWEHFWRKVSFPPLKGFFPNNYCNFQERETKKNQRKYSIRNFDLHFVLIWWKEWHFGAFSFKAPRGRPYSEEHLASGFWPNRLRTDWWFKNTTHSHLKICTKLDLLFSWKTEPKANTQPGTDYELLLHNM